MNRNTIESQLEKARAEADSIIQKYRSLNNLKKIHVRYERYRAQLKKEKEKKGKRRKISIDERVKKGNTYFFKYKKLSKQIEKLKEDLSTFNNDLEDDELSFNSNDPNDNSFLNNCTNQCNNNKQYEEEIELIECMNCKRRQNLLLIQLYGQNSPYHIQFSSVSCSHIHRRKFKHPDVPSSSEENSNPIHLCYQCKQYLMSPTNSTFQSEEFCWPSFFYLLLTNKLTRKKYKSYLWRFIPRQFRFWWILHLKSVYPATYQDITIDKPSPIFNDLTSDIKHWNESIAMSTLPSLAKVCDDLIIPKIMCPWGESVFIHKFGTVPIDIIFQRYLQKASIDLIDPKKLHKVKWCREDYVRDENDDETWPNEEWKIRPTIAFINGVPKVLTCPDHDGGTSDIMIHPCRWKHSLPCNQSDQIAQVIVQSRTVKRAKASAYSTEWQMYEQKGCFSGLDTCNHVEFGRFDCHSILRHEVEDRAISNRYDVNCHLDVLCQKGIISSEMVKTMRESAKAFSDVNSLK